MVDSQSPSKKLIYYGWDTLNEHQAENAAPHLQHLSFDGLTIRNGQYVRTFHNRAGLDDETVEASIGAMSRIRWGRFTDNFVAMFAGAHGQWFDDEAWSDDGHITRNLRRLTVTEVRRRLGSETVSERRACRVPGPASYDRALPRAETSGRAKAPGRPSFIGLPGPRHVCGSPALFQLRLRLGLQHTAKLLNPDSLT